MTLKDTYVSKVIKEGDDIVMLLPQDLLERLSLTENDIYIWHFNEDGTISLIQTNTKSAIGE